MSGIETEFSQRLEKEMIEVINKRIAAYVRIKPTIARNATRHDVIVQH